MTAMYCAVTSGQPPSTSTRGLGAWRAAAGAGAAAAAAPGRCSLWMKQSARDSAPASAPPPSLSATPPAARPAFDYNLAEAEDQDLQVQILACRCSHLPAE